MKFSSSKRKAQIVPVTYLRPYLAAIEWVGQQERATETKLAESKFERHLISRDNQLEFGSDV